MRALLLASGTLLQREIVRFYRDPGRVIGALLPPILFWFLIGSGLGASFRGPGMPEDMSYLKFFFPGTVLLIVLFTSIFSMITVIEDRKEGFLQAVLVAPIPRISIALGKVLGGSLLSFLQGLCFLALAPLAGFTLHPSALPFLLLELWLVAFGLAGVGFWLAWRLDSTQGFHSVMNLFLIPMWLLSGALFPAEGAPLWLRWAMKANPIAYGIAALRHGLLSQSAGLPSPGTCLGVTGLFAAIVFAACCLAVRARE